MWAPLPQDRRIWRLSIGFLPDLLFSIKGKTEFEPPESNVESKCVAVPAPRAEINLMTALHVHYLEDTVTGVFIFPTVFSKRLLVLRLEAF